MSKYPFSKQWKTKQPTVATKKYQKKINKNITPSLDLNERLLLPTQIHPIDGTLMVLVNPPVYKNHKLKPTQGTSIHSHESPNPAPKLKAFYIDHTEVTVEQYKKTHPKHHQTYIMIKGGCSSCPVMGVDWKSAGAHCNLVGKRLPTEEEWESAARGPSKGSLPWSNKIDGPRANLVGEEDGFLSVAPVGSFPLGAGPYGTMDMIGNVWEWVSTPHSPLPKSLRLKQNKTPRIVKGGSWASQKHVATIGHRNVVVGDMKNPTFGFRCAKSLD